MTRRWMAAIVVTLACGLSGRAQAPNRVIARQTVTVDNVTFGAWTLADGSLTCNGTCAAGTAASLEGVTWWIEGSSARICFDGTTPTAAGTTCPSYAIGGPYGLRGRPNLVNMKFISTSGTNAVLVGAFDRP